MLKKSCVDTEGYAINSVILNYDIRKFRCMCSIFGGGVHVQTLSKSEHMHVSVTEHYVVTTHVHTTTNWFHYLYSFLTKRQPQLVRLHRLGDDNVGEMTG